MIRAKPRRPGDIQAGAPARRPESTYSAWTSVEPVLLDRMGVQRAVCRSFDAQRVDDHPSEIDVPFMVRDSTGTIEVDPAGASIVDEKVFSQFQQGEAGGDGFRFGRFSFGSGFAALAGGRRTIGYRLEESAVPVGRPIFVLGEAVDSGGRLRIGKPAKKGASFIVSLKSEEQLESGAKALTSGLLIAAIVSAALGVAALIFGVVKG